MLTASIVSYHHRPVEMQKVINCVLTGPVSVLYIIDNSLKDSLRELCQLSERIRYIHSVNLGYGAGHNIAIREAIEKGATYHVIINPDIYFEANIIEHLTLYMDAHPGVGQMMPKVFYPNGELQYLCKLLPTPKDLIFRRFFPKKWFLKSSQKFELRFSGYNREMNIPFFSGCFMFLRINAWKVVASA